MEFTFSFTELRSAFTEHYTALCSSVASYRVFSLLESSIVQLWRIVELCWAILGQFRSLFPAFMGVLKCIFVSTCFKHFPHSNFFKIWFKLLHVTTSMSPVTEKLHFLIVLIIQKSIFGGENKKNSVYFFNTSFQYLFLFVHAQIFSKMHRASVAYFTQMMNFCFLNWSWFS